jgi:hypothetical protein
MAHTKTYIVAENWGKGFIEHGGVQRHKRI